ncbi:MAG: J domain-containing protein [Oligoflexia bacterium]|nr:J domain-containing protein [Oligoflexia bacterium]
MAGLDPYQVLGVAPNATQDEIRAAYRRLAKKFHPDLNPGKPEAERRFKDISRAYELIGDPENRAKFDRAGEAAFGGAEGGGPFGAHGGPFYTRTQEGPGGGRYSFSFGRGGGGPEGFPDEDAFIESLLRGFRGPTRGEDVQYRLEVSLGEAARGAEREVSFPGGKHLRVRIPPGVRSGMKLRLPGQGLSPASGAPPGDALIEIRVLPMEGFRQEGADLHTELDIPLGEAVKGGEERVRTIDGDVLLRIPQGVNTGRRLKIAGRGLFDSRRGVRGDQIVSLRVKLPERLAPELEEAIRKWA